MEESKRNNRYLDPLSEYAATHQLPTRRDRKYKVEAAEDFFMGMDCHNVSKIYFCETAAPVSLIYFEQGDGEDPFPLLLFPENLKEENEKDKKEHWLNLLDLEHADALISDCFWYAICTECNPKKEFENHQEFLLDRIAANFVSFTLVEDERFEA